MQLQASAGMDASACTAPGVVLTNGVDATLDGTGYSASAICSWAYTCPTAGDVASVGFSSFQTEDGWDFVYIFDGACAVADFTAAGSSGQVNSETRRQASCGSIARADTSAIPSTSWQLASSSPFSCRQDLDRCHGDDGLLHGSYSGSWISLAARSTGASISLVLGSDGSGQMNGFVATASCGPAAGSTSCSSGLTLANSPTTCSGVTGATCSFSCDAGYSASGSHVCGSGGSFSGGSCSASSCSSGLTLVNSPTTRSGVTGATGDTGARRLVRVVDWRRHRPLTRSFELVGRVVVLQKCVQTSGSTRVYKTVEKEEL